MLCENNIIILYKWVEKSTKSQITLLKKALKILKPGHEMIYSTCSILQEENEDYLEIKTWTTDASFRETPEKVEMRRREGCATVEMECSAYYAAAQFKGLDCAVLLYAGDVVHKEGWDYRNWHARNDMREHLFDLAVKCILKL